MISIALTILFYFKFLSLQSELDYGADAPPETGLGNSGIVAVFLVEEIACIEIDRPLGGIP